ncbi:uncharacterized protein CDAR_375951 [Caerostris darwini]|uniref:Uncharacterized protein n=1 Tax=Caerostris darwini TaxID=1538125 RepID=A0AAV4SBC2_9ARAC|nr:uncharacterized protein CDAR_375951 [Caerostris darwini]
MKYCTNSSFSDSLFFSQAFLRLQSGMENGFDGGYDNKIALAVLLAIQYDSAMGFGGGLGGGFGGGYGMGVSPEAFAMGYQANGDGAASFRSEQGDGSGNVRGSYGYRDAQGLYRMVEYSAGQGGFQAAVKTNEPGTDGKENPADVSMNVQPAPAGIQDRYTRMSSGMGGQGGWGAGGFGGMGGAGGMGAGSYHRGGQGMMSGKSGY